MTDHPPGGPRDTSGATAVRASELARLVDGVHEGEGDPELIGVAPLERAEADHLSFLASPKYLPYVGRARAGALLVSRKLAAELPPDLPRILVGDVHLALARILDRFHPAARPVTGIHETALIGAGAMLGEETSIGAYAVIGARARIGARAVIGAQVVVGEDCIVGDDAVLHPHVTLYARTRVGARSILHSGVRAGVDGFGYVQEGDHHRKVPQVGDCVIGADVEIGANTTIDRGSVGDTVIGDGVKIDNLVHLGHNVRVGPGSLIIAQVGVSGSTRIGRGATIGGQAGLNGHITIGDGATIAGQAGVFGDVPAQQIYSGYPARPHRVALRAQAGLHRLPELSRRVRALEAALKRKQTDER
ncbi:MAG: UDP-3-O-(3-hydroxymyristoyl)glucosamine N-acyltransferase [Longimicrobiales bacterium]